MPRSWKAHYQRGFFFPLTHSTYHFSFSNSNINSFFSLSVFFLNIFHRLFSAASSDSIRFHSNLLSHDNDLRVSIDNTCTDSLVTALDDEALLINDFMNDMSKSKVRNWLHITTHVKCTYDCTSCVRKTKKKWLKFLLNEIQFIIDYIVCVWVILSWNVLLIKKKKVHFDDVSLYGTPKEEPLPSLPVTAEKTSSNFLKNQLQAWFQPTDNRLAMKLFGSKKALVKERIRQKTAGHWVIHPCSSFR